MANSREQLDLDPGDVDRYAEAIREKKRVHIQADQIDGLLSVLLKLHVSLSQIATLALEAAKEDKKWTLEQAEITHETLRDVSKDIKELVQGLIKSVAAQNND